MAEDEAENVVALRQKAPMPPNESERQIAVYRDGSYVAIEFGGLQGKFLLSLAQAQAMARSLDASACEKFGHTGNEYAHGDAAALDNTISVGLTADKQVAVVFAKSCSRFDLHPMFAREIAAALVGAANRLDRAPA